MTERLFLEDPNRAHCLAEVQDRRPRAVLLTRSVLYGESKAYHHPQPTDRGHLLAEGRKIKVARVVDAAPRHPGDLPLLVHHLEGDAPARGAAVQVHLDLPRRLLASRAHTLAHLVGHLTAGPRPAVPVALLAPPKVAGNGGVRAHLRGDAGALLRRLREEVAADRKLAWRWIEPGRAPAPDPWPAPRVDGPERVVEVEGLGAFPCDGTHARRTKEVGEVRGRERKRADGTVDVELQVG